MNSWFKKLWHDPVWSKVISGLILGGLAIIASLWSRSDFSTNLSTARAAAWSSLGAALTWLVSPMAIPRAIVLLLVVGVFAAEIGAANRRQRRRLDQANAYQQSLEANAELRKALMIAQSDISEMQRIRAAEQAAVDQRTITTQPAPVLSLDAKSIRILGYLRHADDNGCSSRDLSEYFGKPFWHIEMHLDALVIAHLVKHVGATAISNDGWYLTTKGREYCSENAIEG
jgi:hypothetical protein